MIELISAALIVRDEEKQLAGCLESMAGLVDEMVVVDTGSCDRSREIALAHGARVSDYQWRDDFAVARNYALDQAVGDWILYIDADERLRPYDRQKMQAELADPGLCACTVRFYPQTGFTAYREHRLFRRSPEIRFRGTIHETIMPDLNRIVSAGKGKIGRSGLTIDHLGYDGNQSRKAERNLPLLKHQVGADPGRTYLWWHLGAVYRELGRLTEAQAAWWQGVETARRSTVRGPVDTLCFIELAKLRLLEGQETLELVHEARQWHRGNLLLDWLEARALVAAGRYAEAMGIFAHLAGIDARSQVADLSYDRRILGAWAFAEMGYCAFRMGRYVESENWYRHAEALEPDCLEFRVKRLLASKRAADKRLGLASHP